MSDDSPPATVLDGPIPVRAMVGGPSGEPVGEIVVWLRDSRLSAVEHAWFPDEPPTVWPDPSDLSFD